MAGWFGTRRRPRCAVAMQWSTRPFVRSFSVRWLTINCIDWNGAVPAAEGYLLQLFTQATWGSFSREVTSPTVSVWKDRAFICQRGATCCGREPRGCSLTKLKINLVWNWKLVKHWLTLVVAIVRSLVELVGWLASMPVVVGWLVGWLGGGANDSFEIGSCFALLNWWWWDNPCRKPAERRKTYVRKSLLHIVKNFAFEFAK